MAAPNIRPAYSLWPMYNARLRDVVAGLTAEQLAIVPGPGRWPLWATIGHLTCQRVFGLCDFAGEPGVETTPFPNAAYNCPGDDDLEHVWSAGDLTAALDSTFAIIERCLDTWTVESLDEVITRRWGAEERVATRGAILQRSLAHDISHIEEVNEMLRTAGFPVVDLWD